MSMNLLIWQSLLTKMVIVINMCDCHKIIVIIVIIIVIIAIIIIIVTVYK